MTEDRGSTGKEKTDGQSESVEQRKGAGSYEESAKMKTHFKNRKRKLEASVSDEQ